MPVSRRRQPGEIAFVLAMLAFSLAALWQAWRISGFSSWSSPGMLPMLATGAMSISALVILRNSLRMRPPEIAAGSSLARDFARRITPLPLVLFTALIVVYMLLLERLGFLLDSFLFSVAAMFALGERRIVRTVLVSAISLAAIYLVFQTAFSVVLPEGWLERLFR